MEKSLENYWKEFVWVNGVSGGLWVNGETLTTKLGYHNMDSNKEQVT